MPASDPIVARAPRPTALPARNRRTAALLVAWIAVLMLAAVLVAWLRN